MDATVCITKWMCNDLHLSGNELTVFAYIYNVCQSDKVVCKSVNVTDVISFLNLDERTVRRNIDTLLEQKYIGKRKQGKQYRYYPTVERNTVDTPSNGALFDVSSKKIKKQQNKPTINTYREVIRVWVNQYFADVDGHEELETNLITWINQYQPKHRGTYSPDALNGELIDFMEHHQRDMKRMLEKSKELSRHGNYQMLPSWEKNQNFRSFKKGVENISDYGMDVGVFDHV